MREYGLAIVGGGPAGLSAAIAARDSGIRDIVIVDRNDCLGGLLFQCIHTGFGVRRFGEELTGPEYAERLIVLVKSGAEIRTGTTVIKISRDKTLVVAGERGVEEIRAQAVVFAAGCRERAIGSLPVFGTRPSGVFPAGSAQKMINIGGYNIGERIVVLGSGDIGLIVARRLMLEGKKVLAVVEQAAECGAMLRNRVQCLEEFGIPLLTGCTVSRLEGRERLTGVEISLAGGGQGELSRADCGFPGGYGMGGFVGDRQGELSRADCGAPGGYGRGSPFSGDPKELTRIDCDTLIVSVGLIPETDLLWELGIRPESGRPPESWDPAESGRTPESRDPAESGRTPESREPLDSGAFQAPLPWLFICGNARKVQRLADNVADDGAAAGKNAAEYINGGCRPGNGLSALAAGPPRTERIGSNQVVCLECPSECILTISGGEASGGDCPNGKAFAARELASPARVLTATVRASGGKRLPVKTDRPIPVGEFGAVMSALRDIEAAPDARAGQLIAPDICGSGANVIATRTLSPEADDRKKT